MKPWWLSTKKLLLIKFYLKVIKNERTMFFFMLRGKFSKNELDRNEFTEVFSELGIFVKITRRSIMRYGRCNKNEIKEWIFR